MNCLIGLRRIVSLPGSIRIGQLHFLLLLTACVSLTPQERLLGACEAHDAAVNILAPLVADGSLTDAEVRIVDDSIELADILCGPIPPRDIQTAIDTLEREAQRIAILRAQET